MDSTMQIHVHRRLRNVCPEVVMRSLWELSRSMRRDDTRLRSEGLMRHHNVTETLHWIGRCKQGEGRTHGIV
jgi:hypothetical protein